MKRSGMVLTALATVAIAGMLLAAGAQTPQAADPPGGKILRLINVGSVLTADGKIWNFRPDRDRWETVDESFAGQGKTTHILPLPVPAASIREMVTFGFLLTEAGDCWLYDMDRNKWEKLTPPTMTTESK
jgi:hypothetical protein